MELVDVAEWYSEIASISAVFIVMNFIAYRVICFYSERLTRTSQDGEQAEEISNKFGRQIQK